jgi:hypothetical protein
MLTVFLNMFNIYRQVVDAAGLPSEIRLAAGANTLQKVTSQAAVPELPGPEFSKRT